MSGGSKYEGQWAGNKMNGHGTYTLSNGSKYDGKWRDGEKMGKNNKQTTIIYDNMFSNNF